MNPVDKFDHFRLYRGTSSYMPLLIKYVQKTKGPVLELGSGLFSTPLLHWLCCEGRTLVTYESHPGYFEFAKKFRSANHDVVFVENWEKVVFEGHWSVALIDHSCNHKLRPRQRGDDVLKLKDSVDYLILHDSEPAEYKHYKYDIVWPHFKYRYDWTDEIPNTTVISNLCEI